VRLVRGLSATRISEPTQRYRRLLISPFTTALLTLLGTVGESLGMDPLLESNTSITRSQSLLWQSGTLCDLKPMTPEYRLAPMIEAFTKAVANANVLVLRIA